jgi:hypothetical protein
MHVVIMVTKYTTNENILHVSGMFKRDMNYSSTIGRRQVSRLQDRNISKTKTTF